MRCFPNRFFFVWKTGVLKRLSHNFEWNKVILYELATPKPSSRKQAILSAFILQCFTRHLITFVNINIADLSSKRENRKYKITSFPPNLPWKTRKLLVWFITVNMMITLFNHVHIYSYGFKNCSVRFKSSNFILSL